jgi:F-type H+-transporting ATPase subunit delta
MKRVSPAVARRYATALLEAGEAQGKDACGRLREELRGASALLASQKDLAAALSRPTIPTERKRKIVEAVWSASRSSPLFRRFMELLVARGRVDALSDVERSFAVQWNERRNVALAEVVSAVDLQPAQRKSIGEALEKVTGRNIEMDAAVDKDLLGGVLVRVNGRSYDGTVRGRLRALREQLASGR